MATFKLPDLGEGLAEAEIREWLVQAGDTVTIDQPLLTVETDKAVVEVPSPQAGTVKALLAKAGDIVPTGAPLLRFEGPDAVPAADAPADAGGVVGDIPQGASLMRDRVGGAGSVRATPAVRALARKRDVDLAIVTPTGPAGSITAKDVERAAKVLAEAGPLEPLRGVRRAMAQSMTRAHAEVADVTLFDDADIHGWAKNSDITLRLIRAIAAGCTAMPMLNAWYDPHVIGRRVLPHIDLGIAVETEEGLFVPVLRDIAQRSPANLRHGIDALKRDVRARSIPAAELRGHTFTLSNFGRFGGQYANPLVVPPAVAILGAGRIHPAVVARSGKPAVRTRLPLSLTFDHRAATGAEASACLMAIIKDLERAR